MRLCPRRRFPPLGLHNRIFNCPCPLILLVHTKNKTVRWNLELTPRLHALEGELIHWVDKAENVWLTVGHLPDGWWDVASRSGILAINTKLSPLGLHKRILNSPFHLTLLTHTKHEIIRSYPELAPRLHFFEGELTLKLVTNSEAVAHKSWMVRCSPRVPGFQSKQ